MKSVAVLVASLFVVTITIIIFILFHNDEFSTLDSNPAKKSYIALGDSVASGTGLKGNLDSSACDRTEEAYPSILAKKQNYNLKSLACSGATIDLGISGSQEVNNLTLESQLTQLYRLSNQPDIITITIGANDANWLSLLQSCYVSVCGSLVDEKLYEEKLNTLRVNLKSVLNDISNGYAEKPKVYLIGYYDIFPASSSKSCLDLRGIDANELNFGVRIESKLNNVIESATDEGVLATYVPINFKGHELCSDESWVQGVRDAAPYHPTKEGQAAMAEQIETMLKKG